MRILILTLACLLVGCFKEKQEVDTNQAGWYEYVEDDFEGDYLYYPDPCSPCPDTVTLLVQIDSTTYYDGETEHHWSYVSPDTVYIEADSILYRIEVKYEMPLGYWVTIEELRREEYPWPDSVFRLKKE